MRLNLWELVLHVVGVHGADLLTRRRAQDLDDLDQLVDAGFAGEERLAEHEFRHHTASGPDV